ncbi:hypothetical protein [Winogradskyella pulchriflava]|uniref:Uncharacterized protein n=1 Tax=Winogradskyella pulchriflava TaxID=1110688 RepID=A0ABV6QC74_9FLAO
MSHPENSNQNTLIIQSVEDIQQQIGFGDLKTFLMHCYQNAQLSEQFGYTPQERHSNFYLFRHFYNHLLTLEMYYEPNLTGINTI